MKAAVLREIGGPECLIVGEFEDPAVAAGWVLVELKAAALNRRDVFVRTGRFPFPLPLVPGADGSGVRLDTGEEVVILPGSGWGPDNAAPAAGFEILGGPRNGTYAELVAVREENLFPKPKDWDWGEAAALPVGGVTAYRALFTRGRVVAGETVVILGAGGGVSTFLLSLAVQAGARVLVTTSSAHKRERAIALGAEGGVLYVDDDWPVRLRALADGGADVVVDSVGATWPDALTVLRPGGRLVSLGATVATAATVDVASFYSGQFSLLGTTQGSPRDFAALLATVESASWRPVVDSAFALDDVSAAHRRLDSGEQYGKIVLEI